MFQQNQAVNQSQRDGGRWLCAEGPYLDYMTKMGALNPGIGNPDPKNQHVGSRVGRSRSVLLEATRDRTWSRQAFKNAVEIKNHFNERSNGNSEQSAGLCQRIYILEGLDPNYVEAYGSYFFMDPRFFVRQERNDSWNLGDLESDIHDASFLPSLIDPDRYFRIKYREIRHFGPQLNNWRTTCAVTGRHIAAIGFDGRLDSVAAVARKLSFWSKEGQNGSWDVVILCDPPVQKVNILTQPIKPDIFQSEPFQGGYPDFIKRVDGNPMKLELLEAPPRSSLLDDLCFYYDHHNRILVDQKPSGQLPQISTTSLIATIFPLKIVCSHYMKLIDYFEVILNKLAKAEWRLSRHSDYDDYHRPAVEEQWSSLQLASRRLSEFSDDVEHILRDMGIPVLESGASITREDWRLSDKDLQYIYHRLQKMKTKVDQSITSAMGLSNIVGSRQALSEARRSVKEAKSAKTLTIIGLVFIPLAYTCALFSMSDQFRPGSKLFWVYFAVSIPMILFVFAGTFVIQLGYDDNATWSFEKFKRSWHGKESSLGNSSVRGRI